LKYYTFVLLAVIFSSAGNASVIQYEYIWHNYGINEETGKQHIAAEIKSSAKENDPSDHLKDQTVKAYLTDYDGEEHTIELSDTDNAGFYKGELPYNMACGKFKTRIEFTDSRNNKMQSYTKQGDFTNSTCVRLVADIIYEDGKYPKPIDVIASLEGDRYSILDANVYAESQFGNGTLRDDGLDGDYLANDGIYSWVIKDYPNQANTYNITVKADNLNNKAHYMSNNSYLNNKAHWSNDVDDVDDRSPGDFNKSDTVSVTVIPDDNYNSPEKRINADGKLNWGKLHGNQFEGLTYVFDIDDANATYYVQTSNIIANNPNQTMKTVINLYNKDTEQFIVASQPNNTDHPNISYLKLNPQGTGTLKAQVTLAGNGDGGTFAISVSTYSRFGGKDQMTPIIINFDSVTGEKE